MTHPDGMDLADYVEELTRRHTHVEHLDGRRRTVVRRVTVPALLDQLWTNDIPSGAANEGNRPGFESKPAARLEALDTAARIDLYAEQWIHKLGKVPRSSDTAVMVTQLHGLTPSQPPKVRHAIEADIHRWWIWARVVTGWDAPAWAPAATCPQCGERGTVRIRLADHYATCVNDVCRATWDEHTIGLLAEHIRLEAETTRQRNQPGQPCWCPWPMPEIPDLSRMCGRCGSARCHRALALRLLDTLRREREA